MFFKDEMRIENNIQQQLKELTQRLKDQEKTLHQLDVMLSYNILRLEQTTSPTIRKTITAYRQTIRMLKQHKVKLKTKGMRCLAVCSQLDTLG